MWLNADSDDNIMVKSGLPADKELVARPDDFTLPALIVARLRPLVSKAKKLLWVNPGKTLGLQVLH